MNCSDRTRSNGYRMKKGKFGLGIGKKIVTFEGGETLSGLPREAGDVHPWQCSRP